MQFGQYKKPALFNFDLPRIFLTIFVHLLLASFLNTAGWGQFTPVKYRFTYSPGSKAFGGVSSAVCLSSNGYGNWFGSLDKSTFFLWADTMVDATTSTPVMATGEVNTGTLAAESGVVQKEIKVTSNLVGNTIYVWPKHLDAPNDRTEFVIQVLGDSRTPLSEQIDINFTGLPWATNSRNVIKSPTATTYSALTYDPATSSPGEAVVLATNVGGSSVAGQSESDWHDTYDICCDGVNLYIVWESLNGSNMGHINVTGIKIADGTRLPGYPKQVSTTGIRPSISCNIRNMNSSVNSYLIAMMSTTSASRIEFWWHNVIGGTGGVCPASFFDPSYSIGSYDIVKHCKVVFGTVAGSNTPSVQGIYAIMNDVGTSQTINDPTGDHLIFHRLTGNFSSGFTAGGSAFYIDGKKIGFHPRIDSPGVTTTFLPIVNQYIQAFANPYDGDPSNGASNFDEFHCLYQLDLGSSWPTAATRFPLMIAGGHDDSRSGGTGTVMQSRLLSMKSSDAGDHWSFITSPVFAEGQGFHYLAAVNQMGIHVYWEGNRWFYTRDQRSLDEDIEENTLLTFYNEVRNGTSHGGTVGATLRPSRILAMWTDPNYLTAFHTIQPYSPTDHNVPNNCRLSIAGNDVKLQIGADNLVPISQDGMFSHYQVTWGTLVTLPNYVVLFGDACSSEHFQSIKLMPGSKWEYYGVPPNGGYISNFKNSGKIILQGYGSIVGCNPIDPHSYCNSSPFNASIASLLKIHGGAIMAISDQVTLEASVAQIECLFETQIRDLPGSTNKLSGVLKIMGKGDLFYSRVAAHIPANFFPGDNKFLQIRPTMSGSSCQPLDPEFVSVGSVFSNIPAPSDGDAEAILEIRSGCRSVDISYGIDSAVQMKVDDPVTSVSFEGIYFRKTLTNAIQFKSNVSTPLTYGDLHVVNNNFDLVDNNDITPIIFDGLDLPRTSSYDKILVEGNVITMNQSPTLIIGSSGILFNQTNGKISSNTISGPNMGLGEGIKVIGRGTTLSTLSSTFLCSNEIENCGEGIVTTNWKGIGRLNTISSCGTGHLCGDGNTTTRILYSDISDCANAGLASLSDGDNDIHLVEFTGDNLGHNTFNMNNTSGNEAQIIFSGTGSTHLVEVGVPPSGSDPCATLSTDGRNNFVRGSSSEKFAIKLNSVTAKINSLWNNHWETNGTNDAVTSGDFGTGVQFVCANTTALSAWSRPSVACGTGYVSLIDPSSNPFISEESKCKELWSKSWGYHDNFKYRLGYDSARVFLENCYQEPNALSAFTLVSSCADGLEATGDTVWKEYRDWLKSILFLRPDSSWYCADMKEYAATFAVRSIRDLRTTMAIMKYLTDSSHCHFAVDLKYLLVDFHDTWQDSVRDSIATPFDSTILNLDQVDEAWIRGFARDVNDRNLDITLNSLNSLMPTKNPFVDEIELHYVVSKPTVAKIEVFDILGKVLWTEGQGYLVQGEHKLLIPTKEFASGTYYARIVTLSGEVRSCKLIKQ